MVHILLIIAAIIVKTDFGFITHESHLKNQALLK